MEEPITIFNVIKYIRTALMQDEDLKNLTKKQIFVMEGKENVSFPFITITKSSAHDVVNKDFITASEITAQIFIFHNSYKELTELADKVYNAMRKYFNCVKSTAILEDNYEEMDSETETFYEVLEYTFKI